MTEFNFVRGNGHEIPLEQILPEEMRSFSTQAQQELRAQYVEQTQGVIVVRPWETAEQLEERRTQFEAQPAVPVPTRGMDPQLAARQRAKLLRDMPLFAKDPKGLEKIRHEINELEGVMGMEFTKWEAFDKKDAERKTPKKVLDAVAQYERTRNAKTRLAIVEAAKHAEFLQLILSVEPEAAVRESIASRLSEIQLTAGD
jgi:hypothetical protein